jgi:hypothetical protein
MLISCGANGLTEQLVFLRMLIEKMKLLDIRMTDYVKQIFIEQPEMNEDQDKEQRIKNLKPNIDIESGESVHEEEEQSQDEGDDELEIEFEDDEEVMEEENDVQFEQETNKKMDFGQKFGAHGDENEKLPKIDL